MGPMKLYRLLQALVGALNMLVMGLYKEEITAEEAQARALSLIEKATGELKAE